MRVWVALLSVITTASCSIAIADAPKFELDGNKLILPQPITYSAGAAEPTPESAAALDHVAAYLKAKSFVSLLRIEVHSDATGRSEANQTLTEKRALAVARNLVARGVECRRLIAVGFGEAKPISDNKTPDGRAQNRRTEFWNAALKGKAIGGAPADGGGKVAGDPCAK